MGDKWEVRDNYSDGESYKREEWNKLRDMVSLNEKLARIILDYLDRKGYSVTYPNPANNLSGVDIGGSIGLSNFDALNSAGNSTNSAVKGTEDIINSKLNSLDEKAQIGYRWVERQYSRGTETNLTASMINQMISREKENLSILEIIRFLEVVFGVSIDEINEQILNKVGMQVEVLESQSLTQNKRYYTDLDSDLDGATLINYIYGEGKAVFHKDNGDGTYYLICVDLLNWEMEKKTLFNFNPIDRNSNYFKRCRWDGTYWWYYEVTDSYSSGIYYTYLDWYKYDGDGNEITSGRNDLLWTYADSSGSPWINGEIVGNYLYLSEGQESSETGNYYAKIGFFKTFEDTTTTIHTESDSNGSTEVHLVSKIISNTYLTILRIAVPNTYDHLSIIMAYGQDNGNTYYSSIVADSDSRSSLSSFGYSVISYSKGKYNIGGGVHHGYEDTGGVWHRYFWWHPCIRNDDLYVVDKLSQTPSSTMINGLSLVVELSDGSYREMYKGEDRSSYANNDFSGTAPSDNLIIKDNLVIKVESDGIIRSDEYEWTPDEDFEGVVIVADNDATSLSWGYPSSDGKIREYRQGVSTKINNCGHQTTARIYKVKFI